MPEKDEKSGLLNQLEKKFGLPNLSQMTRVMDSFPDAKQLKLIKDVLETADKVSQSAPELDQVANIIREINNIPIEKLEKLERILKKVEKIMKTAPQDLLQFITSMKE